MIYVAHFQVAGHDRDRFFVSLEETENFAASYLLDHMLSARDLLVSDAFANWRGWKSISAEDRKLSDPWLTVSMATADFLRRHLTSVHGIDIGRVKISHDGSITVHDPTRDCPSRRRFLGTVDDMLRNVAMDEECGRRAKFITDS